MRSLILLPVRVVQRFFSERFLQTASSLSFATLLGLVPLVAVVVAIITHFPFASGLSGALEKFLLTNLLPDRAGAVIAKYLGQFAHKAERLTWIGALALAATALIQMTTIEHAFNAIWRITDPRPLVRRIALHLMTLMVGPVVFGGSLAITTFLASVSFGLVNEPFWAGTVFFRTVSVIFTAALFASLYWAVPNRRISWLHAAIGGFIATAGFAGLQKLFEVYIAKLPTYTVVYGAFAAMPIFLIWLYLSWSVILIGALVVAELPPEKSGVADRRWTKKR
jgi:membrane protein